MKSNRKREQTEQAFLAAAREVFAERGYQNAKITDIAKAAGRSNGSFYNYYENKSQLLDALLDDFARNVTKASIRSRSENQLESIRGAVTAYWNTYREHVPEMIGLRSLAMNEPKYAEKWRTIRAIGIQGILQQLESGASTGNMCNYDLPVLASAILSMMDAFCWTWLVEKGDLGIGPVSDDLAVQTLTSMWVSIAGIDAEVDAAVAARHSAGLAK